MFASKHSYCRLIIACFVGPVMALAYSASLSADDPPAVVAIDEQTPDSKPVFRLQVNDEQRQPQQGVTVVVRTGLPKEPGDSPETSQFVTDVDGSVLVDLSTIPGTANPVAYLWKAGYQLRKIQLPQSEPITLSTRKTRAVRIYGSDSKPKANAKVSLSSTENMLLLPEHSADFHATTDEYGMCQLAFPSDVANSTLCIDSGAESLQFADVSHRAVASLPPLDARDTIFIRLSPTGSISGTVPKKLAGLYRIRLPQTPRLSNAKTLGTYSQADEVEPDDEGKFVFSNIVSGSYMLQSQLRHQTSNRIDPQDATSLITSYLPLVVEPGKTTQVDFEALPSARVSGRVIGERGDGDFSGLKISASLVDTTGTEGYERNLGDVAQTTCNAQGEYSVVLPMGSYRLTTIANERWQAKQAVSVVIGPGAATVRAPDMPLRSMHQVEVRVTDETLSIFGSTNQSTISVWASIPSERGTSTSHTLAAVSRQQAKVQATLPIGSQPAELTISHMGRINLRARVVDLDPSPNFELALDRQSTGLNRNHSLRVRVVDKDGNGVGHVPVRFLVHSATNVMSPATGAPFPARDRISDLSGPVVSDSDGWVSLPPSLVFRDPVAWLRPNKEQAEQRFVLRAETVGVDGNSPSQKFLFTGDTGPDLPEQLRLDDIVLATAPSWKNVSGRLLSKSSEPLPGRIVWLAQAPGMLRAVTNSQGEFRFERILNDGWFFSDVNWTIRKVADLPNSFDLQEGDVDSIKAAESRLPLEQRKKLASEQLQHLQAAPANVMMAGVAGGRQLPPEAYLEPDKYFESLVGDRLRDGRLDSQRLMFVQFWSRLDDAKIRQLAEVTGDAFTRAQLLKILADRHMSAEDYVAAMEALDQVLSSDPRSGPLGTSRDVIVSDLGIELFRRGLLEPHRNNVQAVLDRYLQEMARRKVQFAERYEPLHIAACRALLEPAEILRLLEEVQTGLDLTTDPETRRYRTQTLELAAQLFPERVLDWPENMMPNQVSVWSTLGTVSPVAALQKLMGPNRGQSLMLFTGGMSRPHKKAFAVCESALRANHADAEQATQELCHAIREFELSATPSTGFETGTSVVNWCQAVDAYRPQLSRQVKWHAALHLLSNLESDEQRPMSIMISTNHTETLRTSLCIRDLWPDLAAQVATRAMNQYERQEEFQRGPAMASRNPYQSDFTVLAYLEPERAIAIIDRIQTQAAAPVAANPGNGGNAFNMAARTFEQQIAVRRLAMLRGLLLDADELLSN